MDTVSVDSAPRHRPPRRTGLPAHIRASLSELISSLSADELSEFVSDQQLSGLAYRRLDTEQLDVMLSLSRSREVEGSTYADEVDRLIQKADIRTAQIYRALQAEPARLANVAALWRAMGIEDDIIGAWLIRRLVEKGVDRAVAERMVASAGIAWVPRTDADRWRRVAEEMIRDGWTPSEVRDAITSARAREAVAA